MRLQAPACSLYKIRSRWKNHPSAGVQELRQEDDDVGKRSLTRLDSTIGGFRPGSSLHFVLVHVLKQAVDICHGIGGPWALQRIGGDSLIFLRPAIGDCLFRHAGCGDGGGFHALFSMH